ncbi:hypothetical protein LUX05_21420 [Streptomyces somaliensis]|nr:hypothetical protein [Streptomyces somaliensis]
MRKETGYDEPDGRITSTVAGTYDGTAADAWHGLALVGTSGRFEDPERKRDKLLKGMREAEGVREARPPRTISPPGSDIELKCAVLLVGEAADTSTVPVCAWGDANTVAYVALSTPSGAAPDPDSVDLAATAQQVLDVRAEVRRPIG